MENIYQRGIGMITRNQLREIHDENLPLHILEQDYIQALFLKGLYKKNEDLVFKGGTFLKHAYGLDRFSEDLDFTIYKKSKYKESLINASNFLNDYGIEAELTELISKKKSTTGKLRYKGPLFDGSERSIGSIHIEISERNDVFLEPRWIRLFFKYPETRVENVLGLQKEEAFAEKLRALSTRNKGRDLYDVWFLLNQNVKPDKELFTKKMNVVGNKPLITIDISKSDWQRDLEILLIKPPDFNQVKNTVVATLEDKGFDLRIL